MPPLSIHSPTIVHHMAALDPQTAPPNSIEAIQASLNAHARIIELDITALAQSDYLLVHDPDLESETSGAGPVAGLAPERAKQLTIKHNGKITTYRVPLLSQVVELFEKRGGDTLLQLDFKNVFPLANDEPLSRLTDLIKPLGERVLVSSGADWQLRKIRKLAPWLKLGFDVMYYIDWQPANKPRDPRAIPKNIGKYGYYDDHPIGSTNTWSAADYLQDRCESLMGLVPDISAFYLEHPLVTQSLADGFNWAEALHKRGIKLDAWTMDVTNPVAVAAAPRLLDAGVDMFTTNTPKALAELLKL